MDNISLINKFAGNTCAMYSDSGNGNGRGPPSMDPTTKSFD